MTEPDEPGAPRAGEPEAPVRSEDESRRALMGRWIVLAAADVGAKAAGFAATSAIARHYDAESFGALALAGSIASHAIWVGAWGLDVTSVRTVARDERLLRPTISTVIRVRLAMAVVLYGVLLGIVWLNPALASVRTLVAVVALSLFTGALSLTWVPQALRATRTVAACVLGLQVAYLAFVLAVIRADGAVWLVALALVLAELGVIVTLGAWIARRRPQPAPEPEIVPRWRSMVADSAPIAFSTLLRSASLGSDVVLLGLSMPLADVGHYGGAQKVFLLGISAVSVYFIVLFPRLARRAATAGALRQDVSVSLARVVPVAAAGIVAAMVFAGPALSLLFGERFLPAAPALRILLPAVVVSLVASHCRNALLAAGRQRLDLVVVAIGCCVHLVAKVLLIPALGLNGAALGTLVGECAVAAAGWIAFRRSTAESGSRAV